MDKAANLTVNAIRILSAEGVQKAKSGHPGLPMGAAAMAYALYAKHLRFNPKNPKWDNRDRFILSAGHGSMLLYSLLHLFGYDVSIDDLKSFRQFGSKTPGHPEYGHTPGVETTTGPLGQGIANAVGMAMAERRLAAEFNRPGFDIVDHYTYALVGDGCLMEGISSEAASLAGTLALGRLIVLYDSNGISIEGPTTLAFREDVSARFKAFGWDIHTVGDGSDPDAVAAAIESAKKTGRPSLVVCKTKIGHGSPGKEGTAGVHGEPLGEENLAATKKNLGYEYGPFEVPAAVYEDTAAAQKTGADAEKRWNELFSAYEKAEPALSAEYKKWMSGETPDFASDPEFFAFSGKSATRSSSGEVLNRMAKAMPNLIGGSADLGPSNKSVMKGMGDFSAEDYKGSNLHFGVREHAMAAICNGIALHGGFAAYCSTFFVFCDYMKHPMRLAALMGLPVMYVLTHDSIGVGEDGGTHQPVEHLAMLRSIPGFTVFRPADSKETAAAYAYAVKNSGPTALVLTRQDMPLYENSGTCAMKGGYILKDCDGTPDILLIATGSEVELAVNAQEALAGEGIKARVVSLPSWEVFEAQDEAYKESVIPRAVAKRLCIEAASPFGWHKYAGSDGDVLAMETFGASGPAKTLFEHFGFTTANVVVRAKKVLGK